MLGITSAKVTAAPGTSGWTQVHEFTPDDPGLLRARGRLFAVLATNGTEGGIDTISSGRELIGRLHAEYYTRKNEYPSYLAFLEAKSHESSWQQEFWGKVADARLKAKQ